VRLPPALAARATTQILELLGEPPGRVLELGFAGIEVVVVEPDPAHRDRARERAGAVLDKTPSESFDAVVAPDGADLSGVAARKVILVGHDGSAWSTTPP
jgi:hypothetical protein